MRVKRIIALALLLLANMFLLVHTALPHSHHDGVVCFSLFELAHQAHCSDPHDDMSACCGQEKHTHHHNANSEDCDLKEIVIRQDNGAHQDIIPCAGCLSLQYTIYSLNELFLLAPQYGEQLDLKPYIITYISPYVGTTSSLRAPPVSYFLG